MLFFLCSLFWLSAIAQISWWRRHVVVTWSDSEVSTSLNGLKKPTKIQFAFHEDLMLCEEETGGNNWNNLIGPLFHGWDSFIALYSNSINSDVNQRGSGETSSEKRFASKRLAGSFYVFITVTAVTRVRVFIWNRTDHKQQIHFHAFNKLSRRGGVSRRNTVWLENVLRMWPRWEEKQTS